MGTGPVRLAEVLDVAATVRDLCMRLEPVAVPLHETAALFDELVALEKLAAGAVVRMTARYEEAGAWKRSGARSPEDDISRKTGSTTGQARRNLGTSKRLNTQRLTDDAVRQGRLSPDQADAVSSGADASPADEASLLRAAGRQPLHELRKQAAAARARADHDREATQRRLHGMRSLRRWNDAEGMGNLLLRLPKDSMAEVDAALKAPIDRAYADARDRGRFESWENYAADIACDRLTGRSGSGSEAGSGRSPARNQAVRPDKKVIALIDVEALNRGRVEGDETCEIAGVGPVSVSAVRALMSDAFLSVVVTKGVDVLNVTHLGRQVTAHQRTALEARGGTCERCGSTFRMEIDHTEGWSLTKVTTVEELALFCWHCHDLKTRHDLRVTGPPGRREFLGPDGVPWRGPPDAGTAAEPDPPAVQAAQNELFTLAG